MFYSGGDPLQSKIWSFQIIWRIFSTAPNFFRRRQIFTRSLEFFAGRLNNRNSQEPGSFFDMNVSLANMSTLPFISQGVAHVPKSLLAERITCSSFVAISFTNLS